MKVKTKSGKGVGLMDKWSWACFAAIVVIVLLFVNGGHIFGKKPPRQVQIVGTSFNPDGSVSVVASTTDAEGKAVKCTYNMVVHKPISKDGLTLTDKGYSCVDSSTSTAPSDAAQSRN